MDDLKRDLRAYVDAQTRTLTVEDVLARPRRRAVRVRPEPRRPLYKSLAWAAVVLVAVVAIVTGVGVSNRPAPRPTTSPSRLPTVDLAATPRGWVPVDYGDAQFSVPPDWTVSLVGVGCANESDIRAPVLFLPSSGCLTSSFTVAAPVLQMGVDTTPPAGSWTVSINGIPGWEEALPTCPQGAGCAGSSISTVPCSDDVSCPRMFGFPSLGVSISDEWGGSPQVHRIIETVTHSPRAVVLGHGRIPTVPRSWQRISYGGISLWVPRTWSVSSGVKFKFCTGIPLSTLQASGVSLVNGTYNALATSGGCLGPVEESPASQVAPVDGVLIDPDSDGPLQLQRSSYGACVHVNELTACPVADYPYGILILAVHVPGKKSPVAVEIGLAGNGVTARTILWSMRAA